MNIRQLLLQEVLSDTSGTPYFTVGERISINQERGYLLSIDTGNELRPYSVSIEIEMKIKTLKHYQN